MLDQTTKRKLDSARQILVGKVPDPKAQVEQITTALIYKFMDDMDKENEEVGLKTQFFVGDFQKFSWTKILDNKLSGQDRLDLYVQAITNMPKNPHIPQLFRNIFKGAFLPYNDPRTLSLFLKEINEFNYEHSENLGNAFEYLLSILGSQGDAGQFRTPRHIIDFIVEVVDPKKNETILDPACGTAGFLISAYKHILKQNKEKALTPDEKLKLMNNLAGYDISPDMVKLALVNMYLHGFPEPKIYEYDTLSSEKRWDETFDVIMANPPFMTPKGGIVPHKKFSIQANRAEVLFVDYILEHLNIKGRAGIIVPEGVIFQSNNAYTQLRKKLVEDGLFAVVSLPSGIFNPYSGVKTSILLFDKALSKKTQELMFIKIQNDGYDLGAQRRKIEKNDLPEALKIIKKYKEVLSACHSVLDTESIKKEIHKLGQDDKLWNLVAKEKIAESGDYNLSGDRYKEADQFTNQKWPLVELGEVLEYEQPTKYIVKSIDYNDSYEIPVLTAGKTFILGYTNEKEGIFPGNKLPVIIFDDFTTAIKFVDFPFKVKSSAMKILHGKKDKIDIKFAFYLMQRIKFPSSTHKRYWISEYSRITIPLPPLEIQEQIVTELEGYQKVIDGAKQVVDSWKPSFEIDPKWETKKLGEVCEVFGGGTPSRANSSYWGGNIPWISSKYFTDEHRIDGFEGITQEGLKNSSSKTVPIGSTILITRVSVGKFAIADKEYAINQDLTALVVKDNKAVSNKYLWLISEIVAENIKNNAKGIGVVGVTKDFVIEQEIPLPSLTIQDRIVEKIEEEQKIVEANKRMIELFQKKIEVKVKSIWES